MGVGSILGKRLLLFQLEWLILRKRLLARETSSRFTEFLLCFYFFFLAFFLMPSVRKWKMENADKICLPMLVLRCYGVAKLIYL